MTIRTRPLRPDDLPRLRHVGARAFGIEDESTVDVWVEWGTMDEWRVAEASGRVDGMALRIPMGTWFGGRSVPTVGLAGVAVAAEARATGLGAVMMTDILREARAGGFALASLFASTKAFYRKLGYATAGDLFEIELPLAGLPETPGSLEVVPYEDAHRGAMQGLYDELHRGRDGALHRGPYIWQRVEAPVKRRTDGYLFKDGEEVAGYAFISIEPGPEFYDLRLVDWAVRDAAAADAVIRFLRGHRAMATKLSYYGAAHDPITTRLGSRVASIRLVEPHFVRILHVAGALEARGYPEHLDERLAITVTEDPACPENEGAFQLAVEGGRAEVRRAPATGAHLTATIEGLAALYCGFLPARTLARLGWIDADPAGLATAARLFDGARPYVDQMY